MAYSHCPGPGTGQVEGMGPGPMGPDILYRNVHTGPRWGMERRLIVSIVLVQFLEPVKVPFPCVVNKPFTSVFRSLSCILSSNSSVDVRRIVLSVCIICDAKRMSSSNINISEQHR